MLSVSLNETFPTFVSKPQHMHHQVGGSWSRGLMNFFEWHQYQLSDASSLMPALVCFGPKPLNTATQLTAHTEE